MQNYLFIKAKTDVCIMKHIRL